MVKYIDGCLLPGRNHLKGKTRYIQGFRQKQKHGLDPKCNVFHSPVVIILCGVEKLNEFYLTFYSTSCSSIIMAGKVALTSKRNLFLTRLHSLDCWCAGISKIYRLRMHSLNRHFPKVASSTLTMQFFTRMYRCISKIFARDQKEISEIFS